MVKSVWFNKDIYEELTKVKDTYEAKLGLKVSFKQMEQTCVVPFLKRRGDT